MSSSLNLDKLLEDLGHFGNFQKRNLLLVCFVVIFSCFPMGYIFTARDLRYRCKINGCDDIKNPNFYEPWLENAVPFKNNHPKNCYKFKSNLTENYGKNLSCPKDHFDKNVIETCDEFVYETDEITIGRDFNITCDENLWKLTIVGTISIIGELVCLPIYGYFSDKYGRKAMMIFGGLATTISGLIRSFMPTYTLYLIMEFVDTSLGSGFYSAAFILAMELVIPKQRVIGNTILACAFALGEVILGLGAWISPSWRVMLRILYAPGIFFIAYIWLSHESIRWLLSKGYKDKASEILKKIAKLNGTSISEEVISKLNVEKEEVDVPQENFIHIFKAPRLLFRLINCSYSWICCTFVYYAVSLIEVPAYFVCNYTLSRIGRRLTLAPGFIFSGLACLAFIFVPEDQHYSRLALFLLGKFFATVAYTVLYMYTTEMFPTCLRHSLLATCSMFGRLGSMVAPQIPLLVKVWESLPLMLFGVMAISTGILSFCFPETNRVKLPDTIDEAIEMGRKKKVDVNTL
ncbi:organic cation transporter protein-like isoform X2 [Onthophagus taurus]|uniref:organic cation transporter protein-like isoform X2 n=1 Tax=Onthophagus taurus TaxID=166361 RepID=UPI000C20D481|nr:organic cation transporter protein-like isoform X2 [Onthophagus taurus]